MILRFVVHLDLERFTNNEAARTIQSVTVQQRNGNPKIDALRRLFNGDPWVPPGIEPELTG